ncbi:MAG: nicotinate phosphoribosyltransferase [Bradymonadales bacterium]|nr:MAG: nicotinate phosphoribosyltransferase [Bradymonadales bacterium]
MSSASPLFTDLYQISMALACIDSNRDKQTGVFELFFRECPFGGEYAILSGHHQVRELLEGCRFQDSDIEYLKKVPSLASVPSESFDALKEFDLNDVEVDMIEEGRPVFPRLPLLQARGPVWKLQLIESGLLNALNFSSLVSTYARRIRRIAPTQQLIEFGLRRAQGPNGAMTATRASFIGGFDGSSNVLAAKNFGIPVYGTMAHSFVQSFFGPELDDFCWDDKDSRSEIKQICAEDSLQTNQGELTSFFYFAKSFPENSLLLVDTYDSLQSGVPNAIRVFKFLKARGHKPLGIRLDSGDLVYLSQQARKLLDEAGFQGAKIFASNDLSEEIIDSLLSQGAKIDAFGVGTRLVTCYDQAALGGVYKLVELEGQPRLKISQQTEKMVLPGAKSAYRVYGDNGEALLDYLCLRSEPPPKPGEELLALHPTDPLKRVRVIPRRVEALLKPQFREAQFLAKLSLEESRTRSLEDLKSIREDILRRKNPAPYKVSVSPKLRDCFLKLFEKESPPKEVQ